MDVGKIIISIITCVVVGEIFHYQWKRQRNCANEIKKVKPNEDGYWTCPSCNFDKNPADFNFNPKSRCRCVKCGQMVVEE